MLVGLLLLALVCLTLGIVLTSSTWLIASLIASAGAGFLLWKMSSASLGGPAHTDEADDADSALTEIVAPVADDEAGGFFADAPHATDESDVWVIDGRPRYHLADCAIIRGQDAEAIPYDQAVEDGFMPCSLCEPDGVRSR